MMKIIDVIFIGQYYQALKYHNGGRFGTSTIDAYIAWLGLCLFFGMLLTIFLLSISVVLYKYALEAERLLFHKRIAENLFAINIVYISLCFSGWLNYIYNKRFINLLKENKKRLKSYYSYMIYIGLIVFVITILIMVQYAKVGPPQ